MGFAGGIGLDRVRRQLFVQLQGGQLDRSPGLRHCSEPQSPRPRLCRWGAGLLLASCWGPGFSELDPALGGVREQDQFRLVSQRTAGLVERYGPRARLLNLSDRMEVAMGRIPCPGVMPTIWRSVWLCRRCLWSFGWPAVDLHRPWSASSNPCSHMFCRRVTTVNNVRMTSVMRGCCVADLKPWAVPSELSGGFAGAGQQQGATGLWVHQQFEQGWRRVVF